MMLISERKENYGKSSSVAIVRTNAISHWDIWNRIIMRQMIKFKGHARTEISFS